MRIKLPDMTPIIGKRVTWALTDGYQLRLPGTGRKRVTIPKGHVTNFASVPWFVRWIVSPIDPDIVAASVIHDGLVSEFSGPHSYVEYFDPFTGQVLGRYRPTWNEAAWIMRSIMKASGAPAWKRGIVYSGVRLYGFFAGK